MNNKSQLLWTSYPEDKLKIAQGMGYESFYEMLLGENKKGKNAHEIERACGMSYVQVNKLLRALGGTIKPRGGYNGRKSVASVQQQAEFNRGKYLPNGEEV